jgi:hypothetical protein
MDLYEELKNCSNDEKYLQTIEKYKSDDEKLVSSIIDYLYVNLINDNKLIDTLVNIITKYCEKYKLTFNERASQILVYDFNFTYSNKMNKLFDFVEYDLRMGKFILMVTCSKKQELKISNFKTIDDELIFMIIDFDYFEVYKQLVEHERIKINEKHLELACEARIHDCELIKYIILHKVIPTEKHFKIVCDLYNLRCHYYKDTYDFYVKLCRNNLFCENVLDFCRKHLYKFSEVLNVLICGGGLITLDIVKLIFKTGTIIENFSDLDINVDDELLELFYKNNAYSCIYGGKRISQKNFQELFNCKSININTFNQFIGDREVVYDIECLVNATKSNNDELIYFLLKKGIKPNVKCIINICKRIGSDLLIKLCDAYEKK